LAGTSPWTAAAFSTALNISSSLSNRSEFGEKKPARLIRGAGWVNLVF
jgi:hypothetical protein